MLIQQFGPQRIRVAARDKKTPPSAAAAETNLSQHNRLRPDAGFAKKASKSKLKALSSSLSTNPQTVKQFTVTQLVADRMNVTRKI